MQSLHQYRCIRAAVENELISSNHVSNTTADPSFLSPDGPKQFWGRHSDTRTSSIGGDHEKEQRSPPGAPPQTIPGVTTTRPAEENGAMTCIVGWRDDDPLNPQNWTLLKKWAVTFAVCLLTLAITLVSSIDAPVSLEFNAHYGVDPISGSLTTGMYLLGSGFGALVAGTVSETFGRNVVYLTTFVVFMLCVLAKALAPNYGVAIAFRFLTGFFGSTLLKAAGGTMADVWDLLQLLYAIPVGAMTSYAGPLLGPIVGAYLPVLGFRWADSLSFIFAGAILLYVSLLQPETYAPMLEWRAKHLRALTGDDRYRVGEHATTTTHTLGRRLLVNLYRPFLMVYTEAIILILTFYLTLVYFVLFTFLNGYPFIFQQTGRSVGTAAHPPNLRMGEESRGGGHAHARDLSVVRHVRRVHLPPGFALVDGLDVLLNIWVPIVGSVFFGYGLVTIFTTTFLYTVFVYRRHTASALTFMTSVRYIVAGALIPVSVPMYERLGPHRALTIPAALATVMVPVPFVLYRHGAKIRGMSKIEPH
ncbi:MFS general substrate transporter [Apiospora arundinis]